ncbi:aldehyde dehydrogenase family protein [Actinomadura madurae]|uniref:aldehyde dehydrogenase family protein n=1 Tax=Actinomadura madurae TaxID=1993 RepID=UPI0020D20242|nr:aldehyde dehydrogenase family protein [Actinomadura madurae]
MLDRIVARAGSLAVGDPLDPATEMGPLVSARQRDRVLSYLEAGAAEGARLRAGGSAIDGDGHYVRPSVFDQVKPGMRIAREEIFGPVLAVLEFDGIDEAVRLANDTEYGLAAALWTSDLTTAHRVSRALRAGTVWVNCYEEGDMSVPFGGVKQSGNGRDKSLHALDKYLDLKTTWIAL